MTKPFRRVDLQKESEFSHAGDIKGPARLWGLIRPIGCRQREQIVLKKNGKAHCGIHVNENSKTENFYIRYLLKTKSKPTKKSKLQKHVSLVKQKSHAKIG